MVEKMKVKLLLALNQSVVDTSNGTGREAEGMGKYWGPLNFQDGVLGEWGASKV